MKCMQFFSAVFSLTAAVYADAAFRTPAPPSGADDLTVQVVPAWAEMTANDDALRRAMFPAFGNPNPRWRCPGAVELPASFADMKVQTAVWDANCAIDLSGHEGLEFDFYCEDISQFSQIRFFLNMGGDSWYSVWPFAPEREGSWCRVRFAKKDFGEEGDGGKPGFDKIKGFRIAAWRNGEKNTVIGFANLSYTDAVMRDLTPEEIAARDEKSRAWVKTLAPKKNEWRAFWCHTPNGIGGEPTWGWDRSVKALKDCGFTAICPNLAYSGSAWYKSDVIAESPSVKAKGDQLEACLAACRKYGIELHVWKMCWLIGGKDADGTLAEEARKRGILQVTDAGKTLPDSLCPSDPEIRRKEIAAYVELAKKGVDGIHFDHIRLECDTCYCEGCRKRFERRVGRKIPDLVSAVRADKDLGARWSDFRADCVSELVRGVSEAVRKVSPRVKISAAVFCNPKSDRISLAQDWPLWCRKGWVDFVCPMDYTVSPLLLGSMVKAQKEAAGSRVKVYPGLGISLWPKGTDNIRVLGEQVEVLRKAGLDGFILFNYAVWHLKELEALRKGPFADGQEHE